MRPITIVLHLALGLFVSAQASAHDPFEITSDAHIDERGLNVHTSMSLDTAAGTCLSGADRGRRLAVVDFQRFRPAFEACARDYYAITSGGKVLDLRSVLLQLGVEGDLEMRLVYARPAHSPLSFDALGLKRLAPRAGVVLTVTGQRTFLGQKLLRPDDARLDLPITEDAEAIGTSSPATSDAPPPDPAPRPSSGRLGARVLAIVVTLLALFWVVRRFTTT